MNYLCLWTAILASTREGFSLWPWVVRAGYCSSLLAVLSSAWMLLKRAGTPTIFVSISTTLKLWTSSAMARLFPISRKVNRGLARWAPLWFVAFICAGLVYGLTRLPKDTVVTENHVAIIGQLNNGDFAFVSDEEPHGGTFRPCPDDERSGVDVSGILTKGVGYIADYAKWEERGNCKSILRSDLGFWFKDKRNNFTYERVAHNGQR